MLSLGKVSGVSPSLKLKTMLGVRCPLAGIVKTRDSESILEGCLKVDAVQRLQRRTIHSRLDTGVRCGGEDATIWDVRATARRRRRYLADGQGVGASLLAKGDRDLERQGADAHTVGPGSPTTGVCRAIISITTLVVVVCLLPGGVIDGHVAGYHHHGELAVRVLGHAL